MVGQHFQQGITDLPLVSCGAKHLHLSRGNSLLLYTQVSWAQEQDSLVFPHAFKLIPYPSPATAMVLVPPLLVGRLRGSGIHPYNIRLGCCNVAGNSSEQKWAKLQRWSSLKPKKKTKQAASYKSCNPVFFKKRRTRLTIMKEKSPRGQWLISCSLVQHLWNRAWLLTPQVLWALTPMLKQGRKKACRAAQNSKLCRLPFWTSTHTKKH